jgi:hypothetical protein
MFPWGSKLLTGPERQHMSNIFQVSPSEDEVLIYESREPFPETTQFKMDLNSWLLWTPFLLRTP